MERVAVLVHGETWKDIEGKKFYKKHEKDDHCFYIKLKAISLNCEDLRADDHEYALVNLAHRGVYIKANLKDTNKSYLNFDKETKIYIPVSEWQCVGGDLYWDSKIDWNELRKRILKNR